jgi:adenylate cyclase class 2
MSDKGKEIEVKFYLSDAPRFFQRLEALGAGCQQPRVYEANLRFDTPDRQLSRSLRALRLRMDTAARMTYKGPPLEDAGARLRQELEFTVSDFDTARSLLEALGYQVVVMYEKYRTTYRLDELVITLDEMPFGIFAEIEGPGGEAIQEAARQLGLDWEQRILDSYLVLFDRLKVRLGLTFNDLSFENFQGLVIPPEALGAKPADGEKL